MSESDITPTDQEGTDQYPSLAAPIEMSAAEAREKLKAGQSIRYARIVNLTLNGKFDQPIQIKDCELVTPCFDKAELSQRVALIHCRIIRPRIQRTVFAAGLNLAASTVMFGTVKDTTVKGTLGGQHLHTEGSLRFEKCDFERVNFWEAQFSGWLTFARCQFREKADLRSLSAAEGVSCVDCHFEHDVLLRGSTVTKKLDFQGTRFDSLVDFSKAKLHDFVYMQETEQAPSQRFAFVNTLAERILIEPEQLAGRLASEQAGDHEVACQEYGLLMRNFETLHRYEEQDWAIYRFKVSERRARPRSWCRPWTKLLQFANWLFLDLACGYGTNPLRAVGAAVVLLLVFAPLYMVGIDHFQLDGPLVGSTTYSFANRLVFGIVTSISVLTAGFTGDQLTSARGWVLLPLACEALLGTLLWGFFIVAFSRKVIR